jgi:predicted TIM-barrel fold metal-dependent hydrolase
MKKIAIEEHFTTRAVQDAQRASDTIPGTKARRPSTTELVGGGLMGKLLDVGEGRIAEMDSAGIAMQVLSTTSGVEDFDRDTANALARDVNDELSEAVRRHPQRLAGFATLGYGDPQASAKELERAVTRLGLKGAKINSHVRGEYLDDRKYWPMWEAAESLDVPIYIHPKDPSEEIASKAGYPELVGASWGFSAVGSLSALRLIYSGLFDAHPGLKIILGHLGEGLAYWSWRIDNRWERRGRARPTGRPSEYLKRNFWVTTSGMFDSTAFSCVREVLGAERILFAVDYPFESSEEGAAFIDRVPLADAERAMICHGNAERLLRI